MEKLSLQGSYDNTIKLWDVATRQNIAAFEGHTRDVHSVSFSPDGKTLASGANDGVKLWDVEFRVNITTLEGQSRVRSVSFSPDGATLASGGPIKLWDVATGENIATLRGHTGTVTSVSFSPDGKTLASGSWDGTIRLWDVSEWSTVVEKTPTPDFDGNDQVDFADFLSFVARFGASRGDSNYDAKYDLDGDGTIGFGDFLIFTASFGTSG